MRTIVAITRPSKQNKTKREACIGRDCSAKQTSRLDTELATSRESTNVISMYPQQTNTFAKDWLAKSCP